MYTCGLISRVAFPDLRRDSVLRKAFYRAELSERENVLRAKWPRETIFVGVVAKTMADPRRTRGRTSAMKIFIMKTAYRPAAVANILQLEAFRGLSFSMAARRVSPLYRPP